MKKTVLIACLAAVSLSVAQAQEPSRAPATPKEDPKKADNAAPHQDDAGALLRAARAQRDEKGCATAAPSFRVVAAMGEGQEAAQHELAECLLTMTGANAAETALFRQEGEFWLRRAAFAGNARAQRKLVTEMAAPASALHNARESLQWALVYLKNPTADVYGFGPLPATLVPGLRASLSPEEIAAAEKFAADFAVTPLAKFERPQRKKKGAGAHEAGRPPRRPGFEADAQS